MDTEESRAKPDEIEGSTESTPSVEQVAESKTTNALSGRRLSVTLALTAALLVSGAFCLHLLLQLYTLKTTYRDALREASEAYVAAETEYAQADPASEANAERRRRVSEEMIAQAQDEIAHLEQRSDELDREIREAADKAEALAGSEELSYYRAIYDEYTEGRAYVEELLSKP